MSLQHLRIIREPEHTSLTGHPPPKAAPFCLGVQLCNVDLSTQALLRGALTVSMADTEVQIDMELW